MSKKRKRIRTLRGKFYTTFHTGRLGHPSLVFRLDRKRNKYWIIVFDTTGRNDRIMLKVPIETTVKASFVHKKPVIASHGDLGDHELVGLKVDKVDKPRIELIKRKKPQLTKKYKKYLEQKIKKSTRDLVHRADRAANWCAVV